MSTRCWRACAPSARTSSASSELGNPLVGTTFLLGITIPGPGVLVAAAMAGAFTLLVGRGDTVRLARWAVVGGWFVFALSSPTSEFPLLLRPLGVIVAGGGAVLYRLARPVPVDATREPVALPT